MSDYDKQQWQEQQAVRDAALEKQREKWAKAKARSARNAQRKIARLSQKLSESGDLTDWEEEFAGSVSERLDKFGSAFQDPQLGRPADALSFSQKKVVAALKKKAKEKTGNPKAEDSQNAYKPRSSFKPKGGFKNKNYKPNVRQIEEDLPDEAPSTREEPYIPEPAQDRKPPFLRLVK
ncbi:MAG: hypothetical protein HKN36_03940 [Hellea sp.]|nr:hypothetical protein [Hellea sp.]